MSFTAVSNLIQRAKERAHSLVCGAGHGKEFAIEPWKYAVHAEALNVAREFQNSAEAIEEAFGALAIVLDASWNPAELPPTDLDENGVSAELLLVVDTALCQAVEIGCWDAKKAEWFGDGTLNGVTHWKRIGTLPPRPRPSDRAEDRAADTIRSEVQR